MRRNLLLLLLLSSVTLSFAQSTSSYKTIEYFGELLSGWSESKDISLYGEKIERLCSGAKQCRVEDDLMMRIAIDNPRIPQEQGTYFFDTYMNGISKLIDNNFKIKIDNISEEREASIISSDSNLEYVRYDITLSGSLNIEMKFTNLAFVRNGKITGIYQYAGARLLSKAIEMSNHGITQENAKEIFNLFKNIAANSTGYISTEAQRYMISMELAGVGCEDIDKYVKELDIATYFCRNYDCYNMMSWGGAMHFYSKKNYNYFIGIGETTANWKFLKKHPYINSKGSAFLHYIMPKYRSCVSEDCPNIKKSGSKFGYVDLHGKLVIPYIYSFAYPFDNNTKLALVQNSKGKWGFIDKSGNEIVPFIFDAANDIFVDGKNIGIVDNELNVFDKQGTILRKIYGYTYVTPKLADNELILFNGLTKQYDVRDFNGNLIVKDCWPDSIIGKDSAKNWPKDKEKYIKYYFYDFSFSKYSYKDDVQQFREIKIGPKILLDEISNLPYIDLGDGTKWATKNIGANNVYEMGTPILWGDYTNKCTNGEKNKKNLDSDKNIPSNVINTKYDRASSILGNEWRMPTEDELEFLNKSCIWQLCFVCGNLGYKIIGTNGNSLFLPIEGSWIYNNPKYFRYNTYDVLYWSSQINSNKDPVGLRVNDSNHHKYSLSYAYWAYIRPVKNY